VIPQRVTEAGLPDGLVAIPIRTRLVGPGDDLAGLVAHAVGGIARPDDVIVIAETAVAIAQRRFVVAEFVRPSRLAYALARRAGALATINQPESLQIVIDMVGTRKVIVAGLAHVLGRLRGKRGVFYEMLGEAIAAIDGYTGTLPPYERAIVLGPADPDGFCADLRARLRDRRRQRSAPSQSAWRLAGPGARERRARAARESARQRRRADAARGVDLARQRRQSVADGGMKLALAGALAFTVSAAAGKPLIGWLSRLKYRQRAYEDAPQTHQAKTGTPTMGGLLFVSAPLITLAFAPSPTTLGLTVLVTGMAAIGFVDDLAAIRKGRNRGLRARTKFLLTALVGTTFLGIVGNASPLGTAMLGLGTPPLWVWYGFSLLAILGTTHAVNLTDGLDGLAGGTVLPPLAVLAFIAVRAGAREAATLEVATAGAVLGFLVYNRHPARVFMGDTGSLALGAALAGGAIVTGSQLLLPLIGGVFAAETLSVILQVASFKLTKRRIFRMSPLHHHFELGGWPETKVTVRFWLASAALSGLGFALVARA
jgi:phospho-N-acetylmuramoyl-pentapeptide-transferase